LAVLIQQIFPVGADERNRSHKSVQTHPERNLR